MPWCGVFEPKNVVYEAAAVVGGDLGLPSGWLNDAVKGFLEDEDPTAAPVLDLPGLRVLAASPEVLLALKVLAHRVGEDEDDVRLLASELELQSADQVLAIAERTYGERRDVAARFFVEALRQLTLCGLDEVPQTVEGDRRVPPKPL